MSAEQSSHYQRRQITKPFTEFPKREVNQSVPQRFEEIVRRHPQAIAIRTDSHRLTYAELNRAANRIARLLDRMGGKFSQPVIVLSEHDAPAIVAYLGILKAGQIFVAFDASFPATLLNALLDDAYIVERFKALNIESRRNTPDEFRAFVTAQMERWGQIVKDADIKLGG